MILGYIDPGSGALVIQLLIAGAVGGLVYFRQTIARIFGFGKKKKEEELPVSAGEEKKDGATPNE